MKTFSCVCSFGMLLLPACSPSLEEPSGHTSATLLMKVDMPTRLGGGSRYTHAAPHTKPTKTYALGAKLGGAKNASTGTLGTKTIKKTTELPASADISDRAPEAGDQGQTSSCATWATGYSVMGWWANEAKLPGPPYAPMFLYSQLVNGACDDGTMISDSLDILTQQGIASEVSYQPMQARLDCRLYRPAAGTSANAAQHRIAGYQVLDLSKPKLAIMRELAQGRPVVLGVSIFQNFENADPEHVLIGEPDPGETSLGGHAIAAFAYDAQGVWILNSWTSEWGSNGWAQLTWGFIEGHGADGAPNLGDAEVITGVAIGG